MVQPEIVVPLGNVAAGVIFPQLLGEAAPPISQAHARVYTGGAITVVPMRHPARISNADLARFAARLGSMWRPQPR